MNINRTEKSLMLLCVLSLLSLFSFAGCGGGGRGSSITTSEPARGEMTSSLRAFEINREIESSGAGWKAVDNPVSDLPEASKKTIAGLIPETPVFARAQSPRSASETQLPGSSDWRNKDGKNWASPVKNQGLCGSGAAYSSIAILEAQTRITDKVPELQNDYSENDIFSCGGGVCGKGLKMSEAADYLLSTGVSDEACFPATTELSCSNKCANWYDRRKNVLDWRWIAPTADAVKQALLDGPVIAAIHVPEDFYYYTTGVYSHVTGDYMGWQAVEILGYNDAGGYWIAQNSWGDKWGEKGYFRIKYGELEIEQRVIALEVECNIPRVTANVSSNNVDLENGMAVIELYCEKQGKVTTLEGRCEGKDWKPILEGNSMQCAYTQAGTYGPACRVEGSIVSESKPVIVRHPVYVTAKVSPTSGYTIDAFSLICIVTPSTTVAPSFEGRCDKKDDWSPISEGFIMTCRYKNPGSYIPGCRLFGFITDDYNESLEVRYK